MSRRILYIGGFEMPDKNAAAQRVMANAQLLREMGFEVSFIGISKDIENAPSVVNGFVSTPIKYPKNIRQWIHQILIFTDPSAIMKYQPSYVVLYNFPAIASLRILKFCHKHGIKVIHDITEWECSEGWSPREIIRKFDINLRMNYCMKKMDGVIAISRYLYNYYSSYTQCILIPPTVDLLSSKWNRNRAFSLSKNIQLIYAGSAEFGTKDRLDIIINTVKFFPNLKMSIIGMTKEQYEKGYGMFPKECSNVCFCGRVSHLEAVQAVCNADFQLLIRLKTRKNNAGFPTKFVESLSCCTPVISTETSNITDYLKDGINGYIVDDKQNLSQVFEKLSRLSIEERIKMKEYCRNFKDFDYRNFKDDFSKLFKL